MMRFLSKITFICNLCFVAYVILRLIEINRLKAGSSDAIIPLPWAQGTIVVLGWSAVVVNLLFMIAVLFMVAAGKKSSLPKWLTLINGVFLAAQIVYFLV